MEDLEKKQNYLREQIMDQNYDPELFSQFLTSKKGDDGLDLELWTFNELHDAVIEFKTKLDEYQRSQAEKDEKEKNYFNEDPYQNNNHPSQEKPKEAKDSIQNQNQGEINKKTTKDYSASQDSIDPAMKLEIDYNETVSGKKLPKSVFEQYDNITISISNVEKNQGSIFTKAFITYRINTEQAKLSVVRRYSDFKLLQELLRNVFVGICVPPIPAKNYGDGFTDSFVNKRKRYLEKFLQALLTIPLIRNSLILYDFLSIGDDIELKKSQAKHNELIKPGFNNLYSNDGLLDLRVSKETDALIEQMKTNNMQNEQLLSKLSLLSKSLYQEIQQVSNLMVEISDVLHQLRDCSNNWKDGSIITDLYDIMSKVMKKWSDSEKRKSALFTTNLREHFKYIKNEFALMKELFDKTDSAHKNFYKQFRQLTAKKEELFKKGEIRNWELSEEDMKNSSELMQNKKMAFSKMLPKRTEELALAQKEYGYFTTCVLSEYKRLRSISGIRHKQNCVHLSNENNEMINSLYQAWTDAMMSIESIEF